MDAADDRASPTAQRAAEAPDRLVFFFSGFDPKGAAFYHRLLRDGIALRNASHAQTLTLGPRHRMGRWASTWSMLWRDGPDAPGRAGATRTRMHFMRWDDLVRGHWKRSFVQLLRDYANVYGRGIPTGVFTRVRSKSRSAFWLALFPLGVAVGSFLVAWLLSWGALAAFGAATPWRTAGAGLLIGAVAWRLIARWIDCEWLLRLYAFTREQAIGSSPALDARQTDMASRLVDIVQARIHQPGTPALREVLLVGYSTGSMLAASVLARALPRLRGLLESPGLAPRPALGLLTLGHCIPAAADWAGATQLRRELQELARCEILVWHDYSAPADWAAFARSPPWPRPAALRGHQASPRFHAHMGAMEYAALRRDRREMHLQYLRPPSRPVDEQGYDFFLVTAGPATLAERHERLAAARDTPP